ncbi:MAG TPA: fused MFS/spermidine synthase, partial [Steroidobacteraceae bacterium]|nr:fused MFS/spermidine synthase [Steroidobacteraceae bacterium]
MAQLASIAAARVGVARARTMLIVVMIVASGFAGLGYQIVWTQQSASWLGHEAAAVLAVVAAFFGGIAVGSFVFAKLIDRSAHPARWYAACEAAIGVWSVLLALMLPRIAPLILELIGPQPSNLWQGLVTFVGTFLLLAPATIAMGATLPAIERLLTFMPRSEVRIATLYAANTLGAVIGVLASAFFLIPMLGLQSTASVCASVNFICAAAALTLFPGAVPATIQSPRTDRQPLLWLLAATGLLGIGYEVTAIRVLSQVAENTVYTFALALAVYLFGTSCGASIYGRWRINSNETMRRDRLLQLVALACLLAIAGLSAAEPIRAFVLSTFGNGMTVALLAEATLALVAFLLPTMAMGALFSALSAQLRDKRVTFGRALGWNTCGAALAPIVFGVLFMPAIGATACLLLIVASYALLVSMSTWTHRSQWALLTAICACVLWSPPLAFVEVPDNGRLVSRIEGALATVSVIEDDSGIARLHINNRQQEGSSATAFSDARQALLPLLLHDAPARALFLGMGTGTTALAATLDSRLQVDVVELLPEVVSASEHFIAQRASNFDRSRMHVMSADARRFVRTTTASYDVIISDNFHPARSGSGALYTTEHFGAVRERLGDNGVFCQWLPLHQLDLQTLQSIVRSYTTVFPSAWAILATNSLDTPVIGLLARNDNALFNVDTVLARVEHIEAAARFGIEDELAVLGSFIAGPGALKEFSTGALLNTDDRPIVIYRAPQATYAPESLPRDRLI